MIGMDKSCLASRAARFFRKNGFLPFAQKAVSYVWTKILNFERYYRYQAACLFRLSLNQLGLLRRCTPIAGLPEVIVSLTSFPARIKTVHKAIESLLVQTYPADRIILWLSQEEFPKKESELPSRLQKLCHKGLEIRWYSNIRSYKKLIPTLKIFSEALIITVDDDILCSKYLVERLLAGYIKRPDCLQCHRAALIKYRAIEDIERHLTYEVKNNSPSYLYELTGCAGCLYPPHCFHPDVTNEALFMRLAPTNDDIWFWLMGVLNGYKVNIVENNVSALVYIPRTQQTALSAVNNGEAQLFFVQLRNVLRHYPELQALLKTGQKSEPQMRELLGG